VLRFSPVFLKKYCKCDVLGPISFIHQANSLILGELQELPALFKEVF
jgi:hypothetical protein